MNIIMRDEIRGRSLFLQDLSSLKISYTIVVVIVIVIVIAIVILIVMHKKKRYKMYY